MLMVTDCGGGVLEHELLEVGIPVGAKLGHHLKVDDDLTQLHTAAVRAQAVVTDWVKRTSKEVRIMRIGKICIFPSFYLCLFL